MDIKSKPKVAYAIWIPLLWFLTYTCKPISYWLGWSAESVNYDSYLEGSPLDRNVYIVLIIIGLIILLKRKADLAGILKKNKLIIIYFLYLGLSTLWSDWTFISFKRWTKELGILTMGLIIITESDPMNAIKTIIKRITYMLIPLSIVFNKYLPEYGRQYSRGGGDPQYVGVTSHKNSLGALCLVCGLFLFWDLLTTWNIRNKTQKAITIIFLALIGMLLHDARSATSIAATYIGVCVLIGLSMPTVKNNLRTIKYFLFFIGITLIVIHLSFDLTSLTTSSLGRDETLTGRTQIWEEVLNMKTNPLVGTGYDSFWMGERREYFWDKYWWKPNQAHNGYLETYINLGIIGLILFSGIILSAFLNVSQSLEKRDNYNYQMLRASFIIVFTVMNVTEAFFRGLLWCIFICLAMALPNLPYDKQINKNLNIT